ncbi:uncharacterized protein LOC135485068 [Lineus longissimus]|uniref:uncharacterized protein LOC135485068 n=1 Tax=Lineus longissimus TaxID=88925 RepID=UPI00315CA013
MAKSRVAPLKLLTIPRLELQAAVMASRLNDFIRAETRLQLEKTILFSDSMIVLSWIKQEPRNFKTFVSNRVGEIQMKSNALDWRYCPSELNVADDVSRGRTVDEVQERWICGPGFLKLPEDEWPLTNVTTGHRDQRGSESELKMSCTVATFSVEAPILAQMEKFSSLMRATRVTATLIRFVHNFCAKWGNKRQKHSGPLSVSELNTAEKKLLTHAQSALHPMLGKQGLATLSPYMDEDGIIRVGGRVDKAPVSFEMQHPALLPQGHWLSRLIVHRAHRFGHLGVSATAAKVRRKYWIIGVTRIAKTEKYRCVFCRKTAAQAETQFMADLPEIRLKPMTPPFLHTAVALFGPFQVRISRNKHDKHYGVLFTCLNVRAVYLDLTANYSTMEFCQFIRRFMSVRGTPATILSDRGPQLVGSAAKINEWCCERGTEWQFCTPTAAHQNGCVRNH